MFWNITRSILETTSTYVIQQNGTGEIKWSEVVLDNSICKHGKIGSACGGFPFTESFNVYSMQSQPQKWDTKFSIKR